MVGSVFHSIMSTGQWKTKAALRAHATSYDIKRQPASAGAAIRYDTVYLRALKSWRDGQPNL